MVLVEKYGLQGALLAKTDPKMAKTKPKCCCKDRQCWLCGSCLCPGGPL